MAWNMRSVSVGAPVPGVVGAAAVPWHAIKPKRSATTRIALVQSLRTTRVQARDPMSVYVHNLHDMYMYMYTCTGSCVSIWIVNVEWRATRPESPWRPFRRPSGTGLSQSITLDVSSISIASCAPDRLGQHGCCVPAVTDRARRLFARHAPRSHRS